MKTLFNKVDLLLWTGAIIAVMVLTSCGGGSVAGVGSGGTGIVTAKVTSVGSITGFGSVIVNGVRYDDSGASVGDEDGARNRSDLKLGMVVRVQADVSSNGSATATSINFGSELLGPVSAVGAGGNSFTIIGQQVLTSASTVFDSSLAQGAASVQTGQLLEVHGFLNPANNTLQATLVERKSAASLYKISGLVQQLQVVSKTFQIGNEVISFASTAATDLPSGLANGQLVKLRLTPQEPSAGAPWLLTRARNDAPGDTDVDKFELEGLITEFTSTSQFRVGTQIVDARSASFPNGTSSLALGARVEVKGALQAGVLVAAQVKIENSSDERIELFGPVANINTTAKTFSVSGVTVSYSAAQFDNGSAAQLVNGAQVEVKGLPTANSPVINAERIKFKN
jgi:Domain of unknown function (DUF5666)